MAKSNCKIRRTKSSRIETIKISKSMLDELEAIPDAKQWSEEKDAILLRYGKKKTWAGIAKILGYAPNSCRARYEKLMGML